jgi:hypothetical protein
MDFWHEFTKSVSNAATNTVKEAEKLTDKAKVKYRITALNAKLNETYIEIGQLRYSESLGEKICDEIYRTHFETVTNLTNEINELEDKLSDLRNLASCKNCGAKINKKGCIFCPKCGDKID